MRLRALLMSVPALLLAGCGVGVVDTSRSVSPTVFAGSVHGGEAPVVYSKVSFYETAATGVATNGVYVPATPLTALGSAFTDVNGNFSFASPLHCQNSNNYVYAVAAGGNTGATYGGNNAQVLEMAAVGSCAGFGGSTFVELNEVSTVAAAYALSGFTSISGSYNSGVVSVSGTVASSSAASTTFSTTSALVSGQPVYLIGCTPGVSQSGYSLVQSATSGSFTINTSASIPVGSACNFYALTVQSVPVVSVTSSATNFAPSGAGTASVAAGMNHAFANAATLASLGTANTTIGGDSTIVLPTTMVNTLADVLQPCVNSLGGGATSSTANDGTACGKLFSYTTNVSGTSEVVPANTLQAALNLAHFPAQNVANIIALVPATPAFAPSVTSTPHDLSLAVHYVNGFGKGTNGTGINVPVALALDANDNVYLQNGSYDSHGNFGGNVIAFSNQGQLLWSSPMQSGAGLLGIGADTTGNLFVSTVAPNTSTGVITEYVATTGDFEQTVISNPNAFYFNPALNSAGDLYVINFAGNETFDVMTRSGSGQGTFAAPYIASPSGPGVSGELKLAANGTVFVSTYDSSASAEVLGGVPYTGTGANLYTAPTVIAPGSGTNTQGVYAVALDSTGRVWAPQGNNITPYTPTYSGGQLTGFTAGTTGTLVAQSYPQITSLLVDGGGTEWGADAGSNLIVQYTGGSVHPQAATLNPCVTSGPGCAGTVDGPQQIAGDAAGDLWVVTSSTVLEVIGSAAPVWPAVAVQKQGLMP